jgi:hypothetical protein
MRSGAKIPHRGVSLLLNIPGSMGTGESDDIVTQ